MVRKSDIDDMDGILPDEPEPIEDEIFADDFDPDLDLGDDEDNDFLPSDPDMFDGDMVTDADGNPINEEDDDVIDEENSMTYDDGEE